MNVKDNIIALLQPVIAINKVVLF